MGSLFFGRERQLGLLKELMDKRVASLVVLKGRRRIGKSRLAEEFGKSLKTFFFEGLPPKEDKVTAQDQRVHFVNEMERELGLRGLKADDWDDIFWNLAQQTQTGRVLIVLDEINWMGSEDPTFLGKLKSAWDKHFKKNPKLVLILSGSMSAWIERNILSSTGFLGRVSLDITLEELSLFQCNKFWQPREKQVSAFEKFKILSVTGGVPRYLEEINPKLTAEENIYRLCFRPEALLFKEFDRIFSDLFGRRVDTYRKIVTRLAMGTATVQQVCDYLEIKKGGLISEYLEDLEETQYIARDFTWGISSGEKLNLSRYRLKDNYLRFYLRYIHPHADAIRKQRMQRPPAWDSIMGLQFENLVSNNYRSLYTLLGIPPEEIVRDGPYFQRQTKQHAGCQIDYLIQTKYSNLYVCEVKFSSEPIGSQVIREMQEKIERLHTPKSRFSFRPVLIHVNGVTASVRDSDFFSHIVDFGELLEQHPDRPGSTYC